MATTDSVPGDFVALTAVQVVYRECFRDDQGEFPHSLRFLKLLAAQAPTESEPDSLYRIWELGTVLKAAASRGDLDTVVWLAETFEPEASLSSAVKEGVRRAEVVKWLTEHVPVHPEAAPRIMFEAARAGNLEVVQWMLGEYDVSATKALKAAQEGHQWQVVRWILTNCEVGDRSVDGTAAAKDGDLAFLQWAYEHASVELGGSTLMNAVALDGHLGVLKWLHEGPANIELGASVFAQAARGGHLGMLKWLHSQQCPATAAAMDHAAVGGFLEVLKWLDANREEGCTSRAMDGAARNGHLEVVKWLHGSGKKFYCPFVMDSAAANGHLDVVKWLHEYRSEGCTEDAMNYAARLGHLDVVQWLHHNHSEGCSAFAMDWAAPYGHLDVVKWLHAHRREGCTTWAMDSAAREGHLAVSGRLYQHCDGESDRCWPLRRGREKRSLKANYAAGNVIESPRLELEQWLLQNAPAELEGVWFRVSRGDWYMNEWMQRHNMSRTHQDDRYND
ncbi:hypothetical protein PHYSODRAFT_326245 [Phytophthora sojae]|uniref:Uncharacterized protein n=1 Tax=Phytophthora sojae (strain P6497) TaxID=1094619 RepID=G4YZH8_PHYSP|nr:hypothetical protein PHYSODRAFT_326245 [Phytophthora sojae]EGZ25184.1 hypothetical protein PHYSODRAFT_326245 [Phytophthora sojae]|eukprot:XP_009520472.1 hypothetical protein PHYSODRAFT_326245 [Phytophthora sojae]